METLNQVSAAVPAEGTPAPAPAAKPGTSKVSTSFVGRLKDEDLSAAIAKIIAEMTGNALFPSPVPKLDTLATAADAFKVAVQANDGGAVAVVNRDQAREAVGVMLRELAAYVQHASLGDKLKLMKSGFPVQRERGTSPPQPIAPPVGLKLRRGKASGQVHVRCGLVPGARLYQWRYALAQAPTAWTVGDTSTSTSGTLEGLTSGTLYVWQARAYGKRGASDWSESASLMVV